MFRYAFPLKLNNVVSVYRMFSLPKNHQHSPVASDDVPSFDSRSNWEAELRRTGAMASAWRVTHVNMNRRYVEGYPEYFVVPISWLDSSISVSCSNWTNRRIPVWCWSSADGCALVRSSTLNTVSEVTEKQWHEIENAIAEAHPTKQPSVLVDARIGYQEVAVAFEALRKLCSADSGTIFWQADTRWLAEVEATGWSALVMKCLSMTEQVVTLISQDRRSVIFREVGNADIACVISSLAQLCLDPYFRTFGGFAVLLQKEWVALAHPFGLRLFGLASESRSDEGIAPVFLLFLDCMRQLMLQYPFSFALSSHYLIALWDLALTGLSRTFLFNSLREATNFKGHSMRSAWCMDAYFTSAYRHLFTNPLYSFCRGLESMTERETPSRADNPRSFSVDEGVRFRCVDGAKHDKGKLDYDRLTNRTHSDAATLYPNSSMASYRFWDDCYLRWAAPAQTLRGGRAQTDLQIFAVLADISHQLNELRYLREQQETERTKFGQRLRHYRVQPVQLTPDAMDRITSAFPFGWDTIPIPDHMYILPLRNEKQGQSPQGLAMPRSELELATLCLTPQQTASVSCERLSVWGGEGSSENGASRSYKSELMKLSRKKQHSMKEGKATTSEPNNKLKTPIAASLFQRSDRKLSTDTIV